MQSSEHYIQALTTTDTKKAKGYLMQPHAAQVISIFRLLGMDENSANSNNAVLGSLSKQLVQIGTGEGKSVTLAVMSAALALNGL